MQTNHLLIIDELSTIRLDKWLSLKFKEHSRTYFQTLIEENRILLNGLPITKKDKLKLGDELNIEFKEPEKTNLTPKEIPLEILYEDDSIIIINKPQGLVVHPGAGHLNDTLVHGLLFHCPDLQTDEGNIRPGIVHRLDKETSGVMVIAKNLEAHFHLGKQFENRLIKKTYLAVTIGKPSALELNAPIKRHEKNRQQMAIHPDGKPAYTQFEILAQNGSFHLIKAFPKTGRTHQIRVHLKALNAPIFGDSVYGLKKKEELSYQQMLHASEIEFTHPVTHEPMHFQALPPALMLELIQKKFSTAVHLVNS